nr:delta-like protein 4 [Crassostrea gigas]
MLTQGGVCGGGHLSVRLVGYVNPGGNGENGRPCDGRYFFRGSPCDHRFIICVDKENGGNSIDKCHFGRVETPSIPDQDTVSFPTNIRGLENPILFNVTSWPDSGKFILKVDVWDDDVRSKDEHVEYLYKYFVIKPSGSRYNHTAKRFMLHRRTRLTLELAVFCDQFYFGPSCDIYCQSRNDSLGHYTCNSTGRKQCLKGWRGRVVVKWITAQTHRARTMVHVYRGGLVQL